MNLRETLKLMYVNEASGERNIKLKEYWNTGNGRIVYDGKLKDLLSYMETHDNLNQCDGFPVQVQSIHKWNVVEILVDRTIEEETGLPDYNRGKIIVIIDGEDYIVIGAQGDNNDINLISSKEELLECGYFIDEGKVKTMLNVEILNKLNDGSAANVLKNILFDGENKIDWNEVYNLMLVFMPELKKVDGYKLENMG